MTDQLPSNSEMSSLTSLGQDLVTAEENVFQAEHQLKLAKAKRDHIQNTLIPELMNELGVEELKLTGGRKVAVKPIFSVTPLAENRPLVYAELEKQGAGSLIKTTVSVPFGRGDEQKVKDLLQLLQDNGLAGQLAKKVEPQTLKKHVKERLAEGKPVPACFNVKKFERAEFTEGKPRRPVFDGE